MNKEQIQQKFDEMLRWPPGEAYTYTSYDDLMEAMEFAFNLGLEVAADNAEADVTILTEDGQYEMDSIQLGYD